MSSLTIKRNHLENVIAQMYKANENAEEEISRDFCEILDTIIIDIYLKDNIFLEKKDMLHLSQDEKRKFVLNKRKEISEIIQKLPFVSDKYMNSDESSFRMTSCVKCCCLGIHENGYDEWLRENPDGIYCDVCQHKEDDFS